MREAKPASKTHNNNEYMSALLTSIGSALISIVCGFVSGWLSSWLRDRVNRRADARRILLDMLRKYGEALYRTDADVFGVIEPEFLAFESAVNAARRHDYRKGGEILRYGGLLMGFKPTQEGRISSHCRNYPPKEEAKKYIEQLLRLLEYKHTA